MDSWLNLINSIFYSIPLVLALIFGIIIAVIIIRRRGDKTAKFLLVGFVLLLISGIVSLFDKFLFWRFTEGMGGNMSVVYTFWAIAYITKMLGLLSLGYSLLAMFSLNNKDVTDAAS